MLGMQINTAPASLILRALAALVRRPFLIILLLDLGATAVSVSVSTSTDPNTAMLASLVLVIISLYLQIAIILAASAADPSKSGDEWLRAALGRRVFLRYLGGSLLAYLAIALAGGAGGLVVTAFGAPIWVVMIAAGGGALWMGSVVGLAPQAAALERAGPVEALSVSTIVSRQDRRLVGYVFGILFILPNGTVLAITELSAVNQADATPTGPGWWNLLSVTATTAGVIALTRLYKDLMERARKKTRDDLTG
jgi:hypothetical protein